MKQREIIKLVGLGLVLILTSLAGWWFLGETFGGVQLVFKPMTMATLWNFIASLFFLLLALAIFGILAAVEQKRWFMVLTSAVLPMTLMVALGDSLYTLTAAGIWFLGLLQFGFKIREEKRARIKASIVKYLRNGLGLCVSTLLLAISISFYGAMTAKGTEGLDSVEVLSKFTANAGNQILVMQVPGYNPEMTLDEFILLLLAQGSEGAQKVEAAEAQSELNLPIGGDQSSFFGLDLSGMTNELQGISPDELKAAIPPDFEDQVKKDPEYIKKVFQDIKDQMVGQQIAKAREQLVKALNIEADGDDQMGTVLEKALEVYFDDLFKPFKYLIPPILALTVYFLLQIFGFVYCWITRLLAFLVYGILRLTKFVRYEKEMKECQIIKL
ncbi:MAG: hypothetical protein PHH01_03700 [Patescibacteria group bacterium]|nr:hypothetical protein [Patescibacteria group bacterium]